MKGILKYVVILNLLCIANTHNAQELTEDQTKIMAIVNDAQLLDDYIKSMYYNFNLLDSSYYYAESFINRSTQLNHNASAGLGYLLLAKVYDKQGDYNRSLETVLKAEKIILSEKWPNKYILRKIIVHKGLLHRLMYLIPESFQLFAEANKLTQELNEYGEDYAYLCSGLGGAFLENKQLDSAIYYLQSGITLAQDGKYNLYIPTLSANLARYYSLVGDFHQGIQTGLTNINFCEQHKNYFFKSAMLQYMAQSYLNAEKYDSSIVYAKQAIELSSKYGFGRFFSFCSEIIMKTYEKLGQADSTLKYMKLFLEDNDKIFSKNRTLQFQMLGFQQQMDAQEKVHEMQAERSQRNLYFIILLALFSLGGLFFFNMKYRQNRKISALLAGQKQVVEAKNKELESTLNDLKSAQKQLIQSEKMASLGELTAGIAHEIQNPLNFVNNFSEVNKELVDELIDAVQKENYPEIKALAADIQQNQDKIYQHGKRADAIVKNMLQHSRSNSGAKEPTDLNALCDEYARLSYHGLRAKDSSFTAKYTTELDPQVGKININSQDIGRVLLNLLNNAFYTVNKKAKVSIVNYDPLVTVQTKRMVEKVVIVITDNGGGIPAALKDKIFQPFFTTKPTGEGTGLGLSLAYDIVTKGHGGELTVESKEGEGTTFIISLPIA